MRQVEAVQRVLQAALAARNYVAKDQEFVELDEAIAGLKGILAEVCDRGAFELQLGQELDPALVERGRWMR